MKHEGTLYKSRWDCYTWLILVIVIAAGMWNIFLGVVVLSVIITLLMLAFALAVFLGTYYIINGDKLVVYSFFRPTEFPIDKIAEIRPTKSVLSAPATSLTHRIAITFSDRRILKSSMPLIISPVRQEEFIAQLLAINPAIKL